jgi:hypothetical protein
MAPQTQAREGSSIVLLERAEVSNQPLVIEAEEQEAPSDELPLQDKTQKMNKLNAFKEYSKIGWDLEDEEDDWGATSETSSSISARWLDLPESTEAESADSASLAASMCSSEADTDSTLDYFSPEETIILFDWDDTICPTTALNEDYTMQPDSESMQELMNQAKKTLERAREVAAEVVVVTNATEGWVETSCENWLPGLRPILDMLEFASARSTWEPKGVKTPTGWKAAAFEERIRRFYSRYPQQSWKNVIVIGDACYEHEALSHVASLAPQGPNKRCRAKSVKFAQRPSVELLARELQMLREGFDDIVNHDDDLEVYFNSASL